jgi:hypothetical protein
MPPQTGVRAWSLPSLLSTLVSRHRLCASLPAWSALFLLRFSSDSTRDVLNALYALALSGAKTERSSMTPTPQPPVLGIGKTLLYEQIAAGKSPHRRIGTRIVISIKVLEKMAEPEER